MISTYGTTVLTKTKEKKLTSCGDVISTGSIFLDATTPHFCSYHPLYTSITMRRSILLTSLLSTAAVAAAVSPLNFFRSSTHRSQAQNPMANNQLSVSDTALSISDILPSTRKINIFASLTRDISSVSSRLESTATSQNTTLLAPLNSAMQSLPRKPWEDRPGDEQPVAQYNEDKAAENLKRFVEEHVIPTSPWEEGKENKIRTLGGRELWWEMDGEKKLIRPGGLVVAEVVGRVGNGEVWAIDGVVNYE
jgi:hypothetical protein